METRSKRLRSDAPEIPENAVRKIRKIRASISKETEEPLPLNLTITSSDQTPVDPSVFQNRITETPEREGAAADRTVQISRKKHGAVPKKITWRLARLVTEQALEEQCASVHHCGELNELCGHCGAKFFRNERRNRQGIRLSCCKNGSYAAPVLSPCPSSLTNLFTGDNSTSIQFRNQILLINSLFAMASFKTSGPRVIVQGQGPFCFFASGEIYHFTQGIPDAKNLQRPYLQHYYFLSATDALQHRRAFIRNRVHFGTLKIIETTLRNVNKYVKAYNVMGEVLRDKIQSGSNIDNLTIGIMSKSNMNDCLRISNLPQSPSDYATIFDRTVAPFQIDLKLYSRSNQKHHELKNLNPLADPMVYPLLFPTGDNGYSQKIYYRNQPTKVVTIKNFYCFRIQIRDGFSVLHCGGKLFQQYLVDAWIKVETNLLWWFKQNQNNFFRMSQETMLRINFSRARGDRQGRPLNRVCVLPATVIGSARYKQRQYLDAMAVVARHGKPDLFITFTCNPRWDEITKNLQHKQKWENRPDLVCRVFHVKLMEFLDDIVHKQIYGIVLNFFYVIEFQKRGLPHAHIVVTFIDDDKLEDSKAIDRLISAVIPDPISQPLLYKFVGEFQIHKPCGALNPQAPCMKNRRCSKFFPIDYAEATKLRVGDDYHTIYKRPCDGRTILVPNTNLQVTNQYVVPYNSFAIAKYACHINFEVVGSLQAIKYLFKYVSKRSGVTGRPQNHSSRDCQLDEIQHYVNNRCIGSMEAAWRLLGFRMSGRSHAVMVLPVHLPGERKTYDDHNSVDSTEMPTKLEAWFALNQSSIHSRQYKYVEIPEHYVWDGKVGKWADRKQKSKMIGCIAEVSPTFGNIEKYYLRVLLCHVRGATSFEDLQTVNGEVLPSFKDSCIRRNYLNNLDEYEACLAEAVSLHYPKRLRRLFALICCLAIDEGMVGMTLLWETYSRYVIEDFIRDGKDVIPSLFAVVEQIKDIVARNKDVDLATLEISVSDVVEDNELYYRDNFDIDNGLINADDDDDNNNGCTRVKFDPRLLNTDQKSIFLRIIQAISRYTGVPMPTGMMQSLDNVAASNLTTNRYETLFYVDGPGGTGKTYLYNTLLTVVREVFSRNTVAVAWSGIAASLLIGGKTVHRTFRLPLELNNRATVGWPLEHQRSQRLKDVVLIVWDEVSMTPQLAIEAIDKYLRKIHNTPETPMGGKIVLFGGDFRQILPVIEGGNTTDIIHSTLKYSRLWPEITKLQLTKNMRAGPDALPDPLLGDNTFADWLLRVGEGLLPNVAFPSEKAAPSDLINLPKCILIPSYKDLIYFVYGDEFASPDVGLKGILCPTNAAVDKVNSEILCKLPGEATIYISVDSLKKQGCDDFVVPTDVLNSINLATLPPHELYLKVGAVVILLRNLDIESGLCNGTRLRITALYEHMIECEITSGSRARTKFWLPKIKMTARDFSLPTDLIRVQFPVKLAFAMTINKSQGQTMTKVGLYLNRPCFSHGQLYVAFSRVGKREQLGVYVEEGARQGSFKYRGKKIFTRNVVHASVLSANDSITTDVVNTPAPRRVSSKRQNCNTANFNNPHVIPNFFESELTNRRSIGNKPGTSGLCSRTISDSSDND